VDSSRYEDLGIHAEVGLASASDALQDPWIIGKFGLRDSNHPASLGVARDSQSDLFTDGEGPSGPSSLDLTIPWNFDQDVRAKSTFIEARIREQGPEPRERRRRQEVKGSCVEMRDPRLSCERHRSTQRFGQGCMDARIVPAETPTVRKHDGRLARPVFGAKAEQTVHPAKSTGRLATPELPIVVTHGEEPIAHDAPPIDVEMTAIFSEHRFDRVTPEPDDGSRCAARALRGGCDFSVHCAA